MSFQGDFDEDHAQEHAGECVSWVGAEDLLDVYVFQSFPQRWILGGTLSIQCCPGNFLSHEWKYCGVNAATNVPYENGTLVAA